MTITVEVPNDVALVLQESGQDLTRATLESLVLEMYRADRLTDDQARRMLGYGTRYELDGFLKGHGVYLEYTEEELAREEQVGRRLLGLRGQRSAREEGLAQGHRAG